MLDYLWQERRQRFYVGDLPESSTLALREHAK
jgi:hypothetical protein